jgi:uncharacterized protein (UPF0548 family)
MELRFGDRRPSLEAWRKRDFSPGAAGGPGARDLQLTFNREVGREPPGPPRADGPHRRAADAILRYDIFPPGLLVGVLERTPVEPGDTVGICYRALPFVRLFFAARVVERFDAARGGAWHTGFRYRTLQGHPELGEETFSVQKDLSTGRVTVELSSWSRPGLWLTWIGQPVLRWVQRQASEGAVERLARTASGQLER